MAKEKIAILGGGVGGMVTALALTNEPGWEEKYDITLYQMGWRLGGKGASGRGPDGRIQEHGLHIWLGFYWNAFNAMKDAFAELQDEEAVYKSIDDAFEAHSLVGVMENIDEEWHRFLINFPERAGMPGDGDAQQFDSVLDIIKQAILTVIAWIEDFFGGDKTLRSAPPEGHESHEGFLTHILHSTETLWHEAVTEVSSIARKAEGNTLEAAIHLIDLLPDDPEDHESHHHEAILKLIRHEVDRMEAHAETKLRSGSLEESQFMRRSAMILDLLYATTKGFLSNLWVLRHGDLGALDKWDFAEFLEKHGAKPENAQVAKSGPVRGFYDLVFAYENGDTSKPNFAAGVAYRSAISILLTYKKAIFMEMRAGMGDTIFAPFHKALVKRGVKFEFFHRLEAMEACGTKEVQRLRFARQATLKSGTYEPYVRVNGLDCWPQMPLVDQLEEGEKILKGPKGEGVDGWDGNWKGYDLEDFWSEWENVGSVELKKGEDFDIAVLAIPPASHPFLCPDLVAGDRKWRKMLEQVGSVRTQALQLWLRSDLIGMGWDEGPAVVDAFQQPFNTWADLTHLINRESWPIENSPGNIAYFCGPMPGGIPDPSERGVQQKAHAEVADAASTWLESAPGVIWPGVSTDGALDPDSLVRGKYEGGEGRLKGQFWRANVSPSERYVMSLKGTTGARLPADGTVYSNLYLAGDWTLNGFNAGCVEAATMSGLRASQAISGYPKDDQIQTYWSG